MTGLGDRAEELYVAPRPDANLISAPNAAQPGITLLVQFQQSTCSWYAGSTSVSLTLQLAPDANGAQADNATVEMSFNDDPYAGPPLSPAGKLAADIALVRDVFAKLRRT